MGPKADFQHSERPRLERSCPNLWNKRCDLTDAYFSNSEGKIELLYRNLQSSHKKGPSKPLFKEKGTRSAEHSSSSSAGITSSKYSLRNKDSFDGPSGLVYINRSGLVRHEQADMYGCGAFSDVFMGVIQKEEIDSEIPIEQPGQEVKVAIKKFRVHALRGKDVSKASPIFCNLILLIRRFNLITICHYSSSRMNYEFGRNSSIQTYFHYLATI